MAVDSAANLVQALRQSRLLGPSQLEELTRVLQPRFADPRALARELIEREWLTPYQINQVMQGCGQDLTLGQYVLLQRLDESILGQVFKARHQHMRRLVALTIVRERLLAQSGAVERFYQEIQAAGRLNHPHIVCAFDAGPIGRTHFFALEYVEGISLDRWVQQSGPLPVSSATRLVRQVALGLQHAHERGLLHHDLKPANLLVTRLNSLGDGTRGPGETPRPSSELFSEALIKICNLGLTLLRPRPRGRNAGDESMVLLHKSEDSLDYMAPEQQPGVPLTDIRSNLYSLGCAYYYLLTGRVPFPGTDSEVKLRMHQTAVPLAVQALRPEVPPDVEDTLRLLMAKRPEERYQTPGQLAAVLAARAGSPETLAESWATASGTSDPTLAPQSQSTIPVAARVPRRPRFWRQPWFRWAGLSLVLLLGTVFLARQLLPGSDSAAPTTQSRDGASPRRPHGLSYQKKSTREETILETLRANHLPTLQKDWYCIGPFDNTDKKGFDAVYPPQKGIDLTQSYPGKGGVAVAWKKLDAFQVGRVFDLRIFKNNDWVCAYLVHQFESAEAGSLPVTLGSDDTLTVWFNGSLLVEQNVYRGIATDHARIVLNFRPGKNQLLIKVCNGTGPYAVYINPLWPEQLESAFGNSLRRDFPPTVKR
jgi:serine/threonine protein kinase